MGQKILLLILITMLYGSLCLGQRHNNVDDTILEIIQKTDSLRKKHKKYRIAIEQLIAIEQENKFTFGSPFVRSQVYHKIGVNYFYLQEFNISSKFFTKAIQLRRIDSLKSSDLANSIFLRGKSYQNQMNHTLAIQGFLESIDILKSHNINLETNSFSRKLFQYYSHVAKSYKDLGDVGQSIKYYDAALPFLETAYGKKHSRIANYFRNVGVNFMAIRDSANGFHMYGKALRMYEELNKPSNAPRVLIVKNNVAAALMDFGLWTNAKNTFEENLLYLEENKTYFTDLGYLTAKERYIQNLGYVERMANNLYDAKKRYLESNEIAKQLNPSGFGEELSRTYEGLADVEFDHGNFLGALSLYQKAARSLHLNFNDTTVIIPPQISNSIVINQNFLKRVLHLKGITLYELYAQQKDRRYLTAAFNHYQAVDTLINQIRQSYQSELSQYDLVAGTVPIYEMASTVALELYGLDNDVQYLQAAYDFCSKNKAILLLENKQDEQAKFAGIPDDLLRREKKLKSDSYQIEQEIFALESAENKNQPAIDSAKQVRFLLSRNHEELISRFEQDFPEYHNLKYTAKRPISSKKIISSLPVRSAMIEYFVGFKNILIYTLSADGLKHYAVAKPADFDKRCQAFRKAAIGDVKLSLAEYETQSAALYDLLLKQPLQGLQAQDIDRLFIIPDDYLHELSFDAFLTKPLTEQQRTAGWGVANVPYLLRDFAISYAYSNRLLFEQEEGSRRSGSARKLFAGFGVDYKEGNYTEEAAFATRALAVDWRDRIRPLPYAVEEVQTIADALNGDSWINDEVSKINYLENAKDYQILHFAMHGLVERNFPLNSALIFDKTADSLDYLLTAGDLYASNLNADMVVLSACNTGSGQLQKGEGAMTLARAFNYAGCPSLVASQWNAADEPTKNLMVAFYANLQEGMSKDVAMQKAKLEYLDTGLSPSEAAPHFWSHLAVIGDTSPIDFGNAFMTWLLVGIVASLLLLAFFYFTERKSA